MLSLIITYFAAYIGIYLGVLAVTYYIFLKKVIDDPNSLGERVASFIISNIIAFVWPVSIPLISIAFIVSRLAR